MQKFFLTGEPAENKLALRNLLVYLKRVFLVEVSGDSCSALTGAKKVRELILKLYYRKL